MAFGARLGAEGLFAALADGAVDGTLLTLVDAAAPGTFRCDSAAAETTAALIASDVVVASAVRLLTEFFMVTLSINDALHINVMNVACDPGDSLDAKKANKMLW